MQRLVLLVILAALLVSCGGATSRTAQWVTIDGRDSSGAIIDPINVWNDYNTRGAVVARVPHGTRVKLIQRNGKGVQIETEASVRGWLTDSFIRELK